MWKFLEPVLDSPRTIWESCGVIYAINCVIVCMRPEMAMELGVWRVGCPRTTHCFVLGLLKIVPGLYELDQKRPCVVCMKLFEVNGLSCVEIK